MRFGVCAPPGEAPAILEAGFDYVEVGAAGFGGYDGAWDESIYLGIPIGATNLFFDSRIRLFGPDATPWRPYVERTLERAARLRVPTMVIGSGAARRAQEGMDGEAAFADLIAEIVALAHPYGIVIAPESLNRTETNVGNDLRSMALALRERGAGYTADSYHVLFEWQAEGGKCAVEDLWRSQIPFLPAHVHIANLARTGVSSADPMLASCAARLGDLGYAGSVSLECRRSLEFDLRGARQELGRLFSE